MKNVNKFKIPGLEATATSAVIVHKIVSIKDKPTALNWDKRKDAPLKAQDSKSTSSFERGKQQLKSAEGSFCFPVLAYRGCYSCGSGPDLILCWLVAELGSVVHMGLVLEQ